MCACRYVEGVASSTAQVRGVLSDSGFDSDSDCLWYSGLYYA